MLPITAVCYVLFLVLISIKADIGIIPWSQRALSLRNS